MNDNEIHRILEASLAGDCYKCGTPMEKFVMAVDYGGVPLVEEFICPNCFYSRKRVY